MDSEFTTRQRFLEAVWHVGEAAPGCVKPCVPLETLVTQMKQQSAVAPFLSSLYFAGADVDHPYFLRNDAIAIGLAVLPEDTAKALQRKRHPHQTEVIFVLAGRLCLFQEEAGRAEKKLLGKGDCHVIPKNTYHWISPHEGEHAVFLFVKTSPAAEPRSE